MILVACCGKKLPHAAPARELYQSHLFRLARAYAEAVGGPWAILSAQHFLVGPSRVLEPYDRRLEQLDRDHRDQWAIHVDTALRCSWGVMPGTVPAPVVLAGRQYWELLLTRWCGPLQLPLKGLGVGQQKAWLIRAAKELAAQRHNVVAPSGGAG